MTEPHSHHHPASLAAAARQAAGNRDATPPRGSKCKPGAHTPTSSRADLRSPTSHVDAAVQVHDVPVSRIGRSMTPPPSLGRSRGNVTPPRDSKSSCSDSAAGQHKKVKQSPGAFQPNTATDISSGDLPPAPCSQQDKAGVPPGGINQEYY